LVPLTKLIDQRDEKCGLCGTSVPPQKGQNAVAKMAAKMADMEVNGPRKRLRGTLPGCACVVGLEVLLLQECMNLSRARFSSARVYGRLLRSRTRRQ
jgi:hypothetical protein